MNKLKIIIVDDHQLFREGIRFVIEKSVDIEVIAEAANGVEFLELMKKHNPDVVLMDISMPEMNGIEATVKAMEQYPDLNIIALTMFGDQEYYYKMINAGVKGFVLKESGKTELQKAIADVAAGDNFFSHELLRKIIIDIEKHNEHRNNKQPKGYTPLQFSILKLLSQGMSNYEIGEKLDVTIEEVENKKSKLKKITGTSSDVNLIMYALKNKLIEI